jgi:putative ABC transport system substrate-binding protein
MIGRRDFIAALAGAVAAPMLASRAARAQQPAMPVVGYLYAGAPEPKGSLVAAFGKGLIEAGYVEGRNVAIEYRFADNQFDRLTELAAELVRRKVAVIVAPGATATAHAVMAATTTIPIVFASGVDPIQAGLVASLNRPGGNVTGVSSMNLDLGTKLLGLLHDLLPNATRFAVLANPEDRRAAESIIENAKAAASTIGRQIDVVYASTEPEIDIAFGNFAQKRIEALLIQPNALFLQHVAQISALALRDKLPAIYVVRDFPAAGGLMSYGSSFADIFRQAGVYAGQILKGAMPANLPVVQATKFDFVINLKTAKALGLAFPPGLLAIADEVIE